MNIRLSELKQGLDIVAVINDAGVELYKSGTSLKGCCIFHDDRTPSFFVYPDTQRFHCYGCQESGDVIDFVRKYHGLTFQDALKHLGIEQGKVTPEVRADIRQRQRRRELIELYRRWENEKADEVAMLLRNCRRLVGMIKTEADLEKYGFLYQMIPQLEYEWLDLFINGRDQDKINYFGKEIKWWSLEQLNSSNSF